MQGKYKWIVICLALIKIIRKISLNSLFSKHQKEKLSIINFFVTISENRAYCNNKPTNYQIWCMLVFVLTFVCVYLSQNKNKRMLSAEYFYHLFCAHWRCNAVVSLSKNLSIILLLLLFSLLINQFAVICRGLVCFGNLAERCYEDGQEKIYS